MSVFRHDNGTKRLKSRNYSVKERPMIGTRMDF